MRVIAYNIQPHEKELLTLANGKQHELTLISNDLNDKTVVFAQGKDVAIISTATVLTRSLLAFLKRSGVNRVIVRSADPIAQSYVIEAERQGIQLVNTADGVDSSAHIAQKTIEYLHQWEIEKRMHATKNECNEGQNVGKQ